MEDWEDICPNAYVQLSSQGLAEETQIFEWQYILFSIFWGVVVVIRGILGQFRHKEEFYKSPELQTAQSSHRYREHLVICWWMEVRWFIKWPSLRVGSRTEIPGLWPNLPFSQLPEKSQPAWQGERPQHVTKVCLCLLTSLVPEAVHSTGAAAAVLWLWDRRHSPQTAWCMHTVTFKSGFLGAAPGSEKLVVQSAVGRRLCQKPWYRGGFHHVLMDLYTQLRGCFWVCSSPQYDCSWVRPALHSLPNPQGGLCAQKHPSLLSPSQILSANSPS